MAAKSSVGNIAVANTESIADTVGRSYGHDHGRRIRCSSHQLEMR